MNLRPCDTPLEKNRPVGNANSVARQRTTTDCSECNIDVTLLTGGIDKHYMYGLSMALAERGVKLNVAGNTEMDVPELRALSGLKVVNLYGDSRQTLTLGSKLLRYLSVYIRLIRYTLTARSGIFHILWNYKFQLFDRTLLLLYYKCLGKKVVFTAHNVNAAERDNCESVLNKLSLSVQYRLVDHIFVHTEKMKTELVSEYGVAPGKVSTIPFGIYNCVPNTVLTTAEAKSRLGLSSSEKTILFFGRILPYKGLGYLVEAFRLLANRDNSYRLIIAGEPKKESAQYWDEIRKTIQRERFGEQVIQKIKFISDDDIEVYFKAADALVLPYTLIFQSGVLFMAYSFGLPVIATDVGSLRDYIIEGETGYICQPCDAPDIASAIETYFESNLFKTLDQRRSEIMSSSRACNSWDTVSIKICGVYAQLLTHGKAAMYQPAR
jgi:glycosyltransferase involved in cell wall biosynthesis